MNRLNLKMKIEVVTLQAKLKKTILYENLKTKIKFSFRSEIKFQILFVNNMDDLIYIFY